MHFSQTKINLLVKLEWKKHAACKDLNSDIFFPNSALDEEIPKTVCMNCGVKIKCLEFALENKEENGIWGGLNFKQRKKLQKHLKNGRTLEQLIA